VMDSPIWGITTSVGMNISSPELLFGRPVFHWFQPGARSSTLVWDYTAVVHWLAGEVR
jgi:hypothetical protein